MDPAKMKVVDLRSELGALGLNTKGNKPALVERLKKALEAKTGIVLAETSILDTSTEDVDEPATPRKPTPAARTTRRSSSSRLAATPAKIRKEPEPIPEEVKDEESLSPEPVSVPAPVTSDTYSIKDEKSQSPVPVKLEDDSEDDSDLSQYLELPELNGGVIPLSDGAFSHAWAGARASHGVDAGRVCYEATGEQLTKERQYRLATVDGGPCPDANLDPAINEVAPAVIVEIPNAVDSDTNELISQEIEIPVSEGMTQYMVDIHEDPLPSTSQQSAPLLPTTPLPVTTPSVRQINFENPLPSTLEEHLSPLQSTTPVPVPQPTPRISADVDFELSDLSTNEKQLRVQILKMEFYKRKKKGDEIHKLQLKKYELEIKILEQQLREAQAKADLLS